MVVQRMSKVLWSVLAAAAILLLGSISAFAIPNGTYTLGSHPGGSQSPPPYGLRLDRLTNTDRWTFDFNDVGSLVTMVKTDTSITIAGTVVGGVDNGGTIWIADSIATFDLLMVYDTSNDDTMIGDAVPDTAGVTDTLVTKGHHDNFGMLTVTTGSINSGLYLGTGDAFDLRNHSKTTGTEGSGEDPNGLALQLGDTTTGSVGHRGWSGISGWGWLDYRVKDIGAWDPAAHSGSPSDSGCCSDFLFTVVPEPGTMILFGSGLLGLAAWRRFKKDV